MLSYQYQYRTIPPAAGHRPRSRPITAARSGLLAPPWGLADLPPKTFLFIPVSLCPSKGPNLRLSPPQPLSLLSPAPSLVTLPGPHSLFLFPSPIDDLVDCLRAFDLILRGPRSSALLSTPPPPFCIWPIGKGLRKKQKVGEKIKRRLSSGHSFFSCFIIFFSSSISVSFYCLLSVIS